MSEPNDIYVDSDIGTDTGAGTTGDPYGNIQHALDTVTKDTTDGDRYHGKGSETLAATLTLPTAYTINAPLIFSLWDDNAWTLNGGGNSIATTEAPFWIGNDNCEFRLTNVGANLFLSGGGYTLITGMRLDNGTGGGIDLTNNNGSQVHGNWLEDIAGVGIKGDYGRIWGNYLKNGSTNKFTIAIQLENIRDMCCCNIISIDSTSNGIGTSSSITVLNNSIFSNGGSGKGIYNLSSHHGYGTVTANNLIEGFSGFGGEGIGDGGSIRYGHRVSHNAYFNNTDNENIGGYAITDDNEALGSTLFEKSGSDTFANRATYFEPGDLGNIRGGAFPAAVRHDKGAVQHADPAGGGGGLLRVGMTGGMHG